MQIYPLEILLKNSSAVCCASSRFHYTPLNIFEDLNVFPRGKASEMTWKPQSRLQISSCETHTKENREPSSSGRGPHIPSAEVRPLEQMKLRLIIPTQSVLLSEESSQTFPFSPQNKAIWENKAVLSTPSIKYMQGTDPSRSWAVEQRTICLLPRWRTVLSTLKETSCTSLHPV